MLKNLQIKKKLVLSFIIVSVIACISGIVSVSICKNIDTRYSGALVTYGFAQGDIGKLMAAFCRVDGNVHDAIGYYDVEDQAAATANVVKQGDKLPAYFTAIREKITDATELQLLQTAETAWTQYFAKAKELTALRTTSETETIKMAQMRLVDELDPHYMVVYDSLVQLMEQSITLGNEVTITLTNFSTISIWITVGIIVVSLIISVTFGTYISNGIARPVKACTDRLLLLAQGDVTAPVPEVNSRDEAGQLAEATKVIAVGLKNIILDEQYLLGEMSRGNLDVDTQAEGNYIGDFAELLTSIRTIVRNLNDTMSQIGDASDQVASGSNQVSAGAQALSQGATEQASSVEELAATMTEIYGQVQKNADYAHDANEKVTTMGQSMQASNDQMQKVIAAMSDISQSSSQIGKIIKTIEDIAFQTNILALNAAVEAARAGAAGKGFAVVADEVRNLASKSAEASKNTSVLIEQSIHSVENGTTIVGVTAESLVQAVENAKEVTDLIEKIATSSTGQAQSVSQITLGVDQISSVVQTNSATAEESAAASEELSSQAQMLKDLVGRFQLKHTGRTTGYEDSAQPVAHSSSSYGGDKY